MDAETQALAEALRADYRDVRVLPDGSIAALHQGHHARLRSLRLLAPVLLRGPRAGRQAIRRGVRLTMRKGPEGPCLVLGDAADQLATGPSGCAAFQASTAAALVPSVWISPSLKRTVPTSTNASSCGG